MVSPSGMSSSRMSLMSSSRPFITSRVSSRLTSVRSNGRSSAMISRILSSMRSKSSGLKDRGKRKSYWYFSEWSWRPASMGVPGHSLFTASAMTCSAEWRMTSPASGSLVVTILSSASSSSRVRRSTNSPSTVPATVSLASRGPMAAATSRTVEPAGNSLELPSGRVI